MKDDGDVNELQTIDIEEVNKKIISNTGFSVKGSECEQYE